MDGWVWMGVWCEGVCVYGEGCGWMGGLYDWVGVRRGVN